MTYNLVLLLHVVIFVICVFFFNDTATTEIYTLSLHDALPISRRARSMGSRVSCLRASRPCSRFSSRVISPAGPAARRSAADSCRVPPGTPSRMMVTAVLPMGVGRPVSRSRGLPCGLSLALILAEPMFRAHPERYVFAIGVRVVGDVPVTAGGAEVAAGHGEPFGGIKFLLAEDRSLNADVAVGRALVLDAQAEPAGSADRRGLAGAAACQHG